MQELSGIGHVSLIWALVGVLYITIILRTWALRNTAYSMFSPRGISSICIFVTIALTTTVCAMVTWSLVGPYSHVPSDVINAIYSPTLPENGTITFPYDPENAMEMVFKINFGSMILFYVVLWLVKVAFVVIYFEFSSELSTYTRKLLYITIGAIAVTFAFVICLYSLWCLPISSNWAFEELIQSNTCRASLAPSVIVSVINVLVDILIMAAGFSIIRSLNLGGNDFRSAILIITIGILTVVVAFCRMIVLIVRMTKTDKKYNEIYNDAVPEHYSQDIFIPIQESVVGYAEVEAILACIAACLPGIRVLFRRKARESRNSGLKFKDAASASDISPPASPPPIFEKRERVREMV